MKEKYWDEVELANLKKLYTIDPYSTKECIEEYLLRYPTDYNAIYFYIDILITLKEYCKAYEEIKRVRNIYIKDKRLTYQKRKKIIELAEERLLIRYYLATNQYDDALDYLEYNKCLKANIELELKIYCYKKLGIKSKNKSISYDSLQITDYSEERMINEIKTKMNSMIFNPDFPDKKRFINNFPLEKIIETVKAKMTEDNKLCFGYIVDTYVFKYDCCGRVDEKVQDYFKVICYHDTHDIIMMYPSKNSDKLPYVDINYIKEGPKIKSLTQIEKFNRRYKRK